MRGFRCAALLVVAACLWALAPGGASTMLQDGGEPAWTVTVEPDSVTLEVGATATLTATVRDGDGNVVEDATVVYFSRARASVGVTQGGEVEAYRPG